MICLEQFYARLLNHVGKMTKLQWTNTPSGFYK